jgi:hypothetical protein
MVKDIWYRGRQRRSSGLFAKRGDATTIKART